MSMAIEQNSSLRSEAKTAIGFVCLLLLVLSPASLVRAEDWQFSGVDRIVAVGDVHGAYDALVATLQKAQVIDENLAWSGGKTHLVSTGDLLDRGADSRKVMDLIRRLENEARDAGGRVHQLLGNHEVMNLNGDLRYVVDEEYAAFLDRESEEEREYWYAKFRGSKPEGGDESAVRREFDKKAPPGFFGHRRAFRHDGEYGKWLLEKPFMIVINDFAFTHAGAPPLTAELGLAGINDTLKQDIVNYVTTAATLIDGGVLSPIDGFKEIPLLLVRLNEAGQLDDDLKVVAQSVIDLGQSPLHRATGPTWYRGTAICSGLVEGDALDRALSAVGASRIVIGHTTTETRRVHQRMDGRVIKIDTGMLRTTYGGSGNALLIENDELTVINQNGEHSQEPEVPPIRVGHKSLGIDETGLADILANGDLIELGISGEAWKLVRITQDDTTVFAYFREQRGAGRFLPELAAYRLDRLLRLGMVPVTVRRDVAGQAGTLQFIPPVKLNEFERVAVGPRWQADCPLEKQFAAMSVFDALLRNTGRTPSSMLYDPEELLLILIGHQNSFSIAEDMPANLSNVESSIGNEWRKALRKLDNTILRAELSDVLDSARIDALGKRRDALIRPDK